MNTLYFFTGSYPYGGVETFIENEIEHLSSSFDKVVIVPSEISELVRTVPENVRVDNSFSLLFENNKRKLKSLFTMSFLSALLYHWKYLFHLSAIKRINSFVSDSDIVIKWLMANKLDENAVLYTYWLNGKTHGAIKYRNKYNNKLKVVSRTHRYDLYDYVFKPAFWPYRQKVLHQIDKLYVISKDGVDYLKSKYKVGNNVVISRLGITDRKQLGKTSNDGILRIISVANLNKVKRIPLLLEYLQKFSLENPSLSINWTHFGDGPEMKILQEKIQEKSIKKFKPILRGRVPNHKIYDYYKNEEVDVFINISESEGVPVSIMEAQSYGKYVIGTDVGGTQELISQSIGYLLPANLTFNAFKFSLMSFLEKRSTYVESASEIREKCIDFYDASKNYKEFTQSVLNVLNEE